MRAVAIINAKASTVLEMGPAVVHDIAQGFRTRGYDLEVELLPSENIEPALKSAAARPDLDAVIVGGGDGSLNVAASLLSGTGKALGVVPLGTVNLLARDLQIPFDVIHAVDALSNATVETIDLAEVNGVTFHSIAGLGFLAQMARERQRARKEVPFARWLAFALALWRALSRADRMALLIETDTGKITRRCSAVLVTNNIYRESEWTRRRMSDGLLEVHMVSGWTWWPLARAGLDVMMGRWRQSGRVESILGRELVITTRKTRVPVSVDGEIVTLSPPLHFRVLPNALKVLRPIPANATAQSSPHESTSEVWQNSA